MERAEIKELIERRRRQVLVHSCLYYRLNTNIVDDHYYDMWSRELARLQEGYPEVANEAVYSEEFRGFDGSTGFNLPTHYPEVYGKAIYLMKLEQNGIKK